jgi:hypothetical protein
MYVVIPVFGVGKEGMREGSPSRAHPFLWRGGCRGGMVFWFHGWSDERGRSMSGRAGRRAVLAEAKRRWSMREIIFPASLQPFIVVSEARTGRCPQRLSSIGRAPPMTGVMANGAGIAIGADKETQVTSPAPPTTYVGDELSRLLDQRLILSRRVV